ncbi:capsule biosynthesis protein [Pasteurellaceae bacterium RH1A]|nr:capsule biosynthesis protein [Pasteurellaceae bacterium RH1A]
MTSSLIFSKGIKTIPHLPSFFPNEQLVFASFFQKPLADKVLGWGLRPSTKKARAYALKHHLPYVALEDGFLRSVGLGVAGYPPFAMVYDDVGIYYDTTRPSRLENLILQSELDAEQTQKALDLIIQNKLSKYNQAVDFEGKFASSKVVLVVDQTFGDMAVKYGQAAQADFDAMLQAAIAENPETLILVKTHPDVLSGKKQGYLTQLDKLPANVELFTEDVSPLSLLEKVDKVYCVTSQMGFEALLLGKKVVTFGLPWFAAWGLTDDRHPKALALAQSERRAKRSLLQLFYAAYFAYSRYINPNTGQSGHIFDVIDYLARAKQLNTRLSGHLYCVGMSLWKQAVIKPFFRFPRCHLHFVPSVGKLPCKKWAENDRLLIWGTGKPEVLAYAEAHKIALLRMEDGFIRSVGLGSNLVPPLSLVCDDVGIYFNAERPSRLEQILQEQVFTQEDLDQAGFLQIALVEEHIGKYNVGDSQFKLPQTDKKKILVVGQVEDDASIRTGSPQIFKNLDLLKKVREGNPNAYIVYKPHPDVVSGNRVGHIPPDQAVQFADFLAEKANVLDCILAVDELHTMTSLAGFEALLRGKTVHCYGLPFYSNWGLTVDHLKLERRTRQLSLLELIAGTLVYYPLYIDPNTRHMINAQQAIKLLKAQKQALKHSAIHRPFLAKQWEKLKQLYRTLK